MEAKRIGVFVAVAVVSVLAGAGVEHLRLAAVREDVEEAEPVPLKVTAPKSERASVSPDAALLAEANALRKRVAELEKALAARSAEPAPAAEKPVAERAGEERPPRPSFAERMEQMKQENPEQYAEMQKRREEFRQSMEQRALERSSFLSAVDTKDMSGEQRENHEQLVATVARVNELMAQMMQSGGDRDATRELRQEMGETMATLGGLYESERQYLLESTARAAGYSGDDVSAFVEHVQGIIQNTTMAPGFGMRGRRGGGGGNGQ